MSKNSIDGLTIRMDGELLSRDDLFNGFVRMYEKTKDYSFMVPNTVAIDYRRIAEERYKDAVEGDYYASDAFMVTSKELDDVFVGVSKKFLSRFLHSDEVTLMQMPFFYNHSFNTRTGLVKCGWGEDYGMWDTAYRYYFIDKEDIPQFKAELAEIRKIHVPHFKVNVSTL